MVTCRVLPRFTFDNHTEQTRFVHPDRETQRTPHPSIELLSFLSLAHSFAQWSSINPFLFNSLRTLSIAMGVCTPLARRSGGCAGEARSFVVGPVVVPLEPRCATTENALHPFSLHIITGPIPSQRGGYTDTPTHQKTLTHLSSALRSFRKCRLVPDRSGRFEPTGTIVRLSRITGHWPRNTARLSLLVSAGKSSGVGP